MKRTKCEIHNVRDRTSEHITSIQTSLDVFKALSFEEDELDYRDNSKLIALLAIQDSKSDAKNKSYD